MTSIKVHGKSWQSHMAKYGKNAFAILPYSKKFCHDFAIRIGVV